MRFLKIIAVAVLVAVTTCVNAQTLIEKADKQYELHAYRLAAQSYEFLLNRDADEWGASARLADCYFHLNDLDNAAKWFSRAIEGGNVKGETRLNYGKVLMMQGRYDEAENQFRAYRSVDAGVANHFLKSIEFARDNDNNRSEMNVMTLSKLNSPFSDYGAALFKDQLIWSSSRNDIKRSMDNGDKKDWTGSTNNQLYKAVAESVNAPALKIGFLKSDLKNNYNESNPSFTADGKMVAFMRNNFGDGERISSDGGTEMSIFLANVDNDGNWRDVKPFPHNAASTGFPCFSPDGKSLYFASTRQGGQGGFDLYVSNLRGNMWGEPRNLGSVINTPGDEITPFMDGTNLYFASDFHSGYGGFDIFRSTGLGKDVDNLGTGINSSYDDYGYIFDPSVKIGFFVSNRKGGKGKEDIYRIERQFESVNIIPVDNGKPIKDAKITIKTGDASHLTQLKSGNWLLDLSDKKIYEIELKKDGFKTTAVKIQPNFTMGTRLMEVEMERDVPTQMSALPTFTGVVIDASNGKPLDGVLVRIQNQNTEAKAVNTFTDSDGKYSVTMTPNNAYVISYSREGFINFKNNVKTTDVKNKTIAKVTMKPSALTDKDEMLVQAEPKPKEVPTQYDVRSKGPTKETVTPKGERQGYSVQLFVSTSDDVLNLSKFDNLKSNGNVYIVTEGDKQKVRLGVFNKKEDANGALKKAQELGYKGVFIVEEFNARAVANNTYSPQPKPKLVSEKGVEEPEEKPLPQPIKNKPAPVKDKTTEGVQPTNVKPKSVTQPKNVPTQYDKVVKPKTAAQPETVAPASKVDNTFKVQIAAFKNPALFDDTKVSKYWKIDEVKSGSLTLFMMDGIKTLQQAKDLKAKVKASGYKDAKVVVRDGDKFKVVD